MAYSNPDATPEEIKQNVDNFIKKEFPSPQQEKIEKIKAKPGAMMIQNKKLRNAVSYGLGYIYRQDDVELNDPKAIIGDVIEPITEQDKLIVAKLFSEGKINVLIATAAIGVGVNVNIKNMYLPSCMKYEKNKNNEGKIDLNNKREMSQLVNRTGRGKTKISGIYTPSEFVPFMRDVVMSGNEDFNKVPAISVRPSDNLKDILLNLSTAVTDNASKSITAVKNISKNFDQKLNNFKAAASRVYAKRNQVVNDIRNHDWFGMHAAQLKKDQADVERLSKYSNTQDRIEEFEHKLRGYEGMLRRAETRIADYERELAGSPTGIQTTDERKQQLRQLILNTKAAIADLQIKQNICAVDEYNAIKKILGDIHDESLSGGGVRGYLSSKYNKSILDKRLEEIRRLYDPKLLSDRNTSVKELNNQISEYKKILQDLRSKYNSMQNDPNIPQDALNSVANDINQYYKTIQDSISQIGQIQYYNNQQSKQSGSLKY